MAGLKIVAPELAVLHVGQGSQAPTQITGRVELFLLEPGQISEITVDFVGTVSGRVGAANDMSSKELCKVGRQVSKKAKLQAGLHEFQFAVPVFPHLPASASTQGKGHAMRGFAIEYAVCARAKLGKAVLETRAPVQVRRAHPTSGQTFTVPVRVRNSRPDTLKYEISLPHAAWAAGTTVRARLSVHVLDSRIKMDSVSCVLVQSVRAGVGKGDVQFKQDLATQSGLNAGDNLVQLTIPEDILLSYDNADRGVKIEHSLNILFRFTDQNLRAGELKSAVPLTLLHSSQKDDALAAGKHVEDFILGPQQAYPYAAAPGMVFAPAPYMPPHIFPPVSVYGGHQHFGPVPYAPQPAWGWQGPPPGAGASMPQAPAAQWVSPLPQATLFNVSTAAIVPLSGTQLPPASLPLASASAAPQPLAATSSTPLGGQPGTGPSWSSHPAPAWQPPPAQPSAPRAQYIDLTYLNAAPLPPLNAVAAGHADPLPRHPQAQMFVQHPPHSSQAS